jgi:hypothetical protein
MVGRVLTGNVITCYGEGLTTLMGAEELSDSERDTLLHFPASGSVKVRVLARGTGPLRVLRRQAVAQQTPHQQALEVAPIIPKEPGRLGRHLQSAGALLPLQRRQARWCRPRQGAAPTSAVCRPLTGSGRIICS